MSEPVLVGEQPAMRVLPDRVTNRIAAQASSPILLTAAVLLGFAVRWLPASSGAFPLNDGGLFFVMIEELRRAHFVLPAFTAYNGDAIPFAYPPLGFYAAALVESISGVGALDLLRYIPVVVSTLSIVAFARVARAMVEPLTAVAATFAFALVPSAFIWPVMGGGITRSFGLLFMLLALEQGYRLYTERQSWRVAPTALFCGLTVLSHLAYTMSLAYSLALLMLWFGRDRTSLLRSALVALGTLLVSAPWWVTILMRHGLAPLLAAGGTGGTASLLAPLAVFFKPTFTMESWAVPVGLLVVLGGLVSFKDRQLLVPLWVMVGLLFDARSFPQNVVVPVALLAGVGATRGLVVLIASAREQGSTTDGPQAEQKQSSKWPARVMAMVLAAMVLQSLVGTISLGYPAQDRLTPGEQAAMAWVAAETPLDSRFLVISGDDVWATDRTSEWFPALANRRSAATPQGAEWLPGGVFARRRLEHRDLQACASRAADCLRRWTQTWDADYTHVFVTKVPVANLFPVHEPGDYHWALEYALAADPGYVRVYDGPGAAVFERVAPVR